MILVKVEGKANFIVLMVTLSRFLSRAYFAVSHELWRFSPDLYPICMNEFPDTMGTVHYGINFVSDVF